MSPFYIFVTAAIFCHQKCGVFSMIAGSNSFFLSSDKKAATPRTIESTAAHLTILFMNRYICSQRVEESDSMLSIDESIIRIISNYGANRSDSVANLLKQSKTLKR